MKDIDMFSFLLSYNIVYRSVYIVKHGSRLPTLILDNRCFVCTYAKSGKVIGGRQCLDPDTENAIDVAPCDGQCYVSYSVLM